MFNISEYTLLMTMDQPPKALCPKCHNAMIYVTAMPHRTAHEMRRTTFVCYTCRQTRNYMLSALMADAYAAASGSEVKVISENTPAN
jgi:RNase P subunit RPR2